MWETIIIQPLTNLLLWIYDVLGHGPHMFGLAIILFTILIKLITWPLNAAQVKGAQAMQELQNDKDWQDIQKKYAKDREKLAQEQMRIYKEKGINPFASCLPTLVQFPIIIGLYQSIIRALSATPLDMLNWPVPSTRSRMSKTSSRSTAPFCGWIWDAPNRFKFSALVCPPLPSSWR
jgi:YidC/Oxa1 family membrane protein insertase